ncbi:MFS transporter [Halanaerobium salsuginis]|jgi:oligosaccharide:H+ symporter|uniref:MFS transporter, PPP family, 3-phenylpropionic acid transporter n=1 Tax=Halanaerobium salsuginis TaxID=29563 RepID=A0A1I4IGN7_9FIRM|nr:MFS transporter [Halanaerobium salsuginis]SFL53478.1 MFS transporter, PPP family, 3-phenylpropionic acid transporter [Halanaerobium salsuginis]
MLKNLAAKVKQNNDQLIMTKFSVLQFFFWSSWAILGAYLVYYLTDLGYSNLEIGSMISLRTFMGLLGPPIVGYICDRLQTRKWIFIFSMFLMALVATPAIFYGDFLLVLMIGIIGFLWEPQQSVLDSWILETSAYTAHNYGFMRAWGSIGYAIVVTIAGQVIERFGWTIHFSSYGIIILAVLIVAFKTEDKSYDRLKASKLKSEINQPEEHIIELFKNFDYVFILLISLLIFIPNQMIFIYLAPIIKSVGGNTADLGYTLFFNALSEAPIFFTAKFFLAKYKTKFLLLFSAFFYLLRFIIAALAVSPVYFIFFGMLQSLSYGVFLVAVRYYVRLVAPENLITTAQSITLMAAFGVSGIGGSILGGYLIDGFGTAIMFKVSISMAATAVFILLLVVLKEKFQT